MKLLETAELSLEKVKMYVEATIGPKEFPSSPRGDTCCSLTNTLPLGWSRTSYACDSSAGLSQYFLWPHQKRNGRLKVTVFCMYSPQDLHGSRACTEDNTRKAS